MKSVHILLVEDNEGDILLTTEALEGNKLIDAISVVKNGQEALDFVFQKGAYQNVKIPDLILLDINLPLKSGHEVLQILKKDPIVKHIPVIMLSTSSSEKDIKTAYAYYANCYITKPVDVNQFMDAIACIEHFWLDVVSLSK